MLMPSTLLLAKPKQVFTQIQALTPPKKLLGVSDTLNIAIIVNIYGIYGDTRVDSINEQSFPPDSLLAVNAGLSLKNRLEDSPFFIDYDFPVYKYKRDRTDSVMLEVDELRQLAEGIQADYIITVDIIGINFLYEVNNIEYRGEKLTYTSAKVPYRFLFGYYDTRLNKIKDIQLVNDTLIFDTGLYRVDAGTMYVLDGLPSIDEATLKATELSVQTYADMIVPHWVEEERYFYNDGSRDMKKAVKHVENQEWYEAMEIWMEITSYADLKQAALACFNMALACEMMDDFNLAIEWLNLARKKDPKLSVNEYEQVLYRRLNDKTVIDRVLK
jgi:tetratricopeptide (TPR) repeat protein